jgi:hypothetical protein
MKKFIIIFTAFSMLSPAVLLGEGGKNSAAQLDRYAPDPLSATYLINEVAVPLRDGRHEEGAAPGSAAVIRTYVFGQPAYGDIDGDGDEDAAVFLSHDPGGTGTFSFVAVALNENGNYRGTNAVLLGDRVITQNLKITSGVIVANYFDRFPQEPMAVLPSINKSKHLVFERNMLIEITLDTKKEQILAGWVTIGHEVRSLLPCSRKKALWLLSKSPALDEIMMAYERALLGKMPYTPIFMTLAGRIAKPPVDGFGADYEAAFLVMRLVQSGTKGNCKSDLIYLDSPLPNRRVASAARRTKTYVSAPTHQKDF